MACTVYSMSAENPTIPPFDLPDASRGLRLVNTQHVSLPAHHRAEAAERFSDTLSRGDVRWLYAVRVQTVIDRGFGLGRPCDRQAMVDAGERMGLSDMQSRAIIGIVEDAQTRGGLDRRAAESLLAVPVPESGPTVELSDRARWMVFGVLFGWALLIAGLMQLV